RSSPATVSVEGCSTPDPASVSGPQQGLGAVELRLCRQLRRTNDGTAPVAPLDGDLQSSHEGRPCTGSPSLKTTRTKVKTCHRKQNPASAVHVHPHHRHPSCP